MAATFAAVESRINSAVIRHIANVTADFGGGLLVDGVFDATYANALGIGGTQPVLLCKAGEVTSVTRGDVVTLNGEAFSVAEKKPDGTGMVTLVLESV